MGRGISLHVGLNRIDPRHYGTAGILFGCVNDARTMASLARAGGYEPSVLIDAQATAGAVLDFIRSAADQLRPGDSLLFTYAGHGAQVTDRTGDDADGRDETLCTFDRMILDDELAACWHRFRAGVRIVFISDSCHSGTVARELLARFAAAGARGLAVPSPLPRALPIDTSIGAYRRHRDLYVQARSAVAGARATEPAASALLLAACQDHQTAGDLPDHGVFTHALLRAWDDGRFTGGWTGLFERARARMPAGQTPNLLRIGPPDPALEATRPFGVPRPITPIHPGGPVNHPDAVIQPIFPDFDYSWRNRSRELGAADPANGTSRCVFEVNLDRSLVEGKSDEEVFRLLCTQGVDVLMDCWLTARQVQSAAPRQRGGGEVSCSVDSKGNASCTGSVRFSF